MSKWVRGVLVVLVLAGGGAWGWSTWAERSRVELANKGQTLLDEGHLREAAGVADMLQREWPDRLDGYILGAYTLRAIHDRPATSEVLQRGYDASPRSFPMLAEYVDHRMRGPDDPQKGYDALAFLASHEALYPEDVRLVARARLVACAYLLGQEGLPEADKQKATKIADEALVAFRIDGQGTTSEHYDRAQVLIALGRTEEAIAEGRKGIAADTDRWQALVMWWALVIMGLHYGDDERAWNDLVALNESLATWPGTHFGMGKPLVEFVQLTARVRFGRALLPPPDYTERLERLEIEGVKSQYGDADTRDRLTRLFAAMSAKDNPTAFMMISDLLTLVARDRGCEMENQLIRPNTEAMLFVLQGDLYLGEGRLDESQAAYERAELLFSSNPWFRARAAAVERRRAELTGDLFLPPSR